MKVYDFYKASVVAEKSAGVHVVDTKLSERKHVILSDALQNKIKNIMADLGEGLPRRRYGVAKFKKPKKGKRYEV